ncbi:MAG TPA: prepilin-type N-terminal cleavage/methylation domain-containing protein [Phycisphaerales bacterium]|nr:prepilin-type N-terminal cleavage/methylation domain-containing protein [Phycisphaerales bacterium]
MRRKTLSPRTLTRASGRAFTLMEMMVGVGAVAIIAVGLAAIFDSVGKTVAGGRRVSVMNTYASLMESQMRRDFENMARDGFLVIRHQWVDIDGNGIASLPAEPATSPDDVPLFANQRATDQKPRRIDEIQFGVVGRYETARQPLIPGVRAESHEALVYYGHGQRARLNTALTAENYKKSKPFLSDPNIDQEARLGFAAGTGTPNPNQYPSDWTLLRHVTLLVNPDAAQTQPVPLAAGGSVFGVPNNPASLPFFRNRPTQYFLQPAQSSLFRSVAWAFPVQSGAGSGPESPAFAFRTRWGAPGTNDAYPLRSSGIVDIASSSFADIRMMVTTCDVWPDQVGVGTPPREAIPDGRLVPVPLSGGTALDLMHAWMNDSMPTDSRNRQAVANRIAAGSGEPPLPATFQPARIRYEPGPDDLLPAISMQPTTGNPQFERAVARADQLMLSASNFVPHCTNFIVEWSYGSMDGNGHVRWYGLNPGPYTPPGARVQPYGVATTADPLGEGITYVTWNLGDPNAVPPQPPINHPITSRLIYGIPPANGQPDENAAELTAYFGYTDPTFAPDASTIPVPFPHRTTNGVMDWMWPKMVRIRVTLADPNNLADEREFVYVFNVPDDRAVMRRD